MSMSSDIARSCRLGHERRHGYTSPFSCLRVIRIADRYYYSKSVFYLRIQKVLFFSIYPLKANNIMKKKNCILNAGIVKCDFSPQVTLKTHTSLFNLTTNYIVSSSPYTHSRQMIQ
jgi:hypothetical protein